MRPVPVSPPRVVVLSLLALALALAGVVVAVGPGAAPAPAAGSCRGAHAFTTPGCRIEQRSGTVSPTARRAALDRTSVYADDCIAKEPRFRTKRCELGLTRGRLHVALVGNSIASQWSDALRTTARRHGWRLTTYLSSGCAPSDLATRRASWDHPASASACRAWASDVRDRLRGTGVDVVVVSAASGRYDDAAAARRGYASWMRPLTNAGVAVEVVRSTPHPSLTLGRGVPDCLRAHPRDYTRCGGSPGTWLDPDPLFNAVRDLRRDRSGQIDMTDRLCKGSRCPAAVGGVLAYRDGQHLTRTYVSTMTDSLAWRLRERISEDR